MQIIASALGVMQILAFLDTNMTLQGQRENQHKTLALGVLPNAMAQRECFCVAVEYRLNSHLFTLLPYLL